MKKNILLVSITCLFVLLITATTCVSLTENINTQEVVVKNIIPIYDTSSGVVVDQNNVTFNDKNQIVKYKVVLENTQNYDVKINNISLSTPTEQFLKFEVEELEDNVLKANGTKEITVSFETIVIKGWGRNFADKLIANITFDKVANQEEVTTPDDNKDVQPEAPATNTEELITKTEEIDVTSVSTNTIEFKEDVKVEEGDKIAVWIYSKPQFLGYFNVIVENGVKKIEGLEDALKKAEIETGEHNIALVSDEGNTLGYINVYIDENNELYTEKPSDSNEEVENPFTKTNGLIIILMITAGITITCIFVGSKNKTVRYSVIVLAMGASLTLVDAQESIELPITFNVSFESQNVMKSNGCVYDSKTLILNECTSYWEYRKQIKNFYIQNEITEIKEYVRQFDLTKEQNGRVKAYLVTNKENNNYYDLYLQAEGIIYPNENASYYFGEMNYLDVLDNIAGFDTSKVTNMEGMFYYTGCNSKTFTMDVSSIDTSKVTTMNGMFNRTGFSSKKIELDVSNFDTSNVTDMSYMFIEAGYNSPTFTLDVSGFDTKNVTDMSYMLSRAGYNNTSFTLDVSNFDTSKVTNMNSMFDRIGYSSTKIELNISNFDTSNVTNMRALFQQVGYNNPTFTLDVSNFDTSKVTDMSYMFNRTGYNSTKIELDVSDFDTSNVTDMTAMFYGTGYNNSKFTLDTSNFDTGKVTHMTAMFYRTGYNSDRLNTEIAISNPKTAYYENMFGAVAIKNGSQIKVNYTSATSSLVDKMIATKSSNSYITKGNLVE